MNTYVNLWYLAEFLDWEMLEMKVVEKIRTHFMLSNFSRKSCRLWDNVEDNIVEPDRPQITT